MDSLQKDRGDREPGVGGLLMVCVRHHEGKGQRKRLDEGRVAALHLHSSPREEGFSRTLAS